MCIYIYICANNNNTNDNDNDNDNNHDKNNEDNNNVHHDKQAARSRKQAILFYSESHQRLLWGLSMFAVP